jgi:glycosyltransferase involved in cell wall biosynthesis
MSPLTLLEAQLMEKPVIATKIGGIPELMKDNHTGYLVEKGNPQDIIEKLEILFADNKKANEFGKEGRKFVSENFSWNIIAKRFLQTTKEFGF